MITLQSLSMTGPDVLDYLQRLTTLNTLTIKPDVFHLGFFLTNLGKIQAVFWVKPGENNKHHVLVPSSSKTPWIQYFLDTVEKFKFSESFEIQMHNSQLPPEEFPATLFERHSLFNSPPDAIEALMPRLDHELEYDQNPLEVGFRDLFTQPKGCYPGQEVVEKMISLGSSPKKLVRIESLNNAPLPSDIELEANVGIVKSAYQNKALAIVRKTHAIVGTSVQTKTGIEAKVSGVSQS